MSEERCRFFRNKSMCVSGVRVKTDDAQESAAASYCWCNHTMSEIGEDDHLVGSRECSDPRRTCYEPV
jgi:hypothetical protein